MNLKQAFYWIAASLAQRWASFRRLSSDSRVSFLLFHGVHDHRMERVAAPPSTTLAVTDFEAILRTLWKHYAVVTIDAALEMLDNRSRCKRECVVITFDDSLACLARLAAPRLAALGMPATFFVSTRAIEAGKPYWWHRLHFAASIRVGKLVEVELPGQRRIAWVTGREDGAWDELKATLRRCDMEDQERIVGSVERQLGVVLQDPVRQYPYAETMSWEDVRALTRLGMTVGSHSVSHAHLPGLEPTLLQSELASSKALIEKETGTVCRHLAYPYGHHSPGVREMARRCGYVSALLAVGPGWNQPGADPFALKRFPVPSASDKLRYLLSGAEQQVERLRSRLAFAPPHCPDVNGRGEAARTASRW